MCFSRALKKIRVHPVTIWKKFPEWGAGDGDTVRKAVTGKREGGLGGWEMERDFRARSQGQVRCCRTG